MSQVIRVKIVEMDDPKDYQELVEAVDEISHEVATELAMMFFGCNSTEGTPVWTVPLTTDQLYKLKETLDIQLAFYSIEYGNLTIRADDDTYSGEIIGDTNLYNRNVVAHEKQLCELFPGARTDGRL